MQSLLEWWDGVMSIQGARWIIYPALLAVLVLFAYYALTLVRNLAVGQSRAGEFDYLGEFRRMRDEGHLDQSEYKTLAGLVPLPETESREPDRIDDEEGTVALTEAAKEAIRRSAAKKQADNVGQIAPIEVNGDDDEHSED